MPTLSPRFSLISLFLLLALVISGMVSIGASLLLGIAYSLTIGNHYQIKTHWASGIVLKSSIVILGFGLNFVDIAETAQNTFVVTLVSIVFTMVVGLIIGKLLKVEQKLSFLIAGGTAICGGSAIAALAPVIQARPSHIIVSITIIFLLNAAGLFIYPELGSYFNLTETKFGLWAALGIHDTSSVVGAAAMYGEEAMRVATTTKLARALWIIPLVIVAGAVFHNKDARFKFPLFIVFFVLASIITSIFGLNGSLIHWSQLLAKTGMAVSLFLIGAGFTRETLTTIQWPAFWQGISLWLLVSVFSYWLINIL